MRTRALMVMALLAPLAMDLSAQLVRPRTGGRTPLEPATPPREIPEVARALSIQRSRWSAEAYTMISSVQVPAATGDGGSSYSTFGTGTHSDYRFTDRFSGTVDMTYSPLGSVATTATAEVGARFKPMPFDEEIRPFFDLRAGYMYLSDMFAQSTTATPGMSRYMDGQRYSRGFAGIAGAGIEYSVSNSLSITTAVSAMQGRMTAYRLTGPATIPAGNAYTSTVYRFALGLRYNATRTASLAQNPRQ